MDVAYGSRLYRHIRSREMLGLATEEQIAAANRAKAAHDAKDPAKQPGGMSTAATIDLPDPVVKTDE